MILFINCLALGLSNTSLPSTLSVLCLCVRMNVFPYVRNDSWLAELLEPLFIRNKWKLQKHLTYDSFVDLHIILVTGWKALVQWLQDQQGILATVRNSKLFYIYRIY